MKLARELLATVGFVALATGAALAWGLGAGLMVGGGLLLGMAVVGWWAGK